MSQPQLQPAIPNYTVSDVAATSAFYQKLGFAEVAQVPAPSGAGLQWAMLVRSEATVMLQNAESMVQDFPDQAVVTRGLVVWIKLLSGIDQLLTEATAAGIALAKPLHETFYGAREFIVRDPDGVLVSFSEDVAE